MHKHCNLMILFILISLFVLFVLGCGSQPVGSIRPSGSVMQPTAIEALESTATPIPAPAIKTPTLSGLKAIVAGQRYSLAVDSDGRLLAWGNYAGAILGEDYPRDTEKINIIDTGVRSVSAAEDFCAEIKLDGALWVWGSNKAVCGESGSPSPVKMLDGVASVALGGSFVLAVKGDGTLWSWGSNDYGQLADGGKSPVLDRPTMVMESVKKAVAGYSGFSLILKTDGTLLGCGYNSGGQLMSLSNKKVPLYEGAPKNIDVQTVPKKLMAGVKDVAAGESHSLVLDTSGNLWAFGANNYGQIGDNWGKSTKLTYTTLINAECREPVKVMTGVRTLLASNLGSGAIKSDGSLWLWGYNDNNELGNGGFATSYVPENVLGEVAFATQSATHGMAVKTDGSLWCWGNNRDGELGMGYRNYEPDYVKIAEDVKQVTTSGNTTLVVKNDGSLYGFGDNDYGQLGKTNHSGASTPQLLMKDVSQAALGDYSAFCIKKDGSLWSWGMNTFGALGNGKLEAGRYSLYNSLNDFTNGIIPEGYRKQLVTPDVLHAPAKVLDGVKQVFVFRFTVLAVKTDATLWGWGMNEGGVSFADNTYGDTASPSKRMTGISSVLDMFMVQKTDGWIWTWGDTYIGDPAHSLVKSNISGASSAIGDTIQLRMAVKSDGTLWAWGIFGDKKFDKPVMIEDHVKKITRGEKLFILKDDNTLYSVMYNNLNEFMKSVSVDGKSKAHLVSGKAVDLEMNDVTDAISANPSVSGGESSCSFVIKTDGSLWALGFNKFGQLGNGKVFFRPVQVS